MPYRSWSKDEGIGTSPEAESGIGARDIVERCGEVWGKLKIFSPLALREIARLMCALTGVMSSY